MTTAPRIVAVEDNPADARLLEMALVETGEPCTLDVLRDGDSAVAFVESVQDSKTAPALFVVDLHLPGREGVAVLHAVRCNPALAGTRLALMTSSASPEEESEARALGVDWFGVKAVDWDGTVAQARELLALCRPRASAASL